MYHLIIDTCVWVDLCKSFPKLCPKIANLVKQEKVRLILPAIIIDEWNRLKPKILEEQKQSIRGKLKNARELAQYLEGTEADEFKAVLDRFQEQVDQLKNPAVSNIESVESLFNHPSTILLETTETAKVRAADFALAKKAPFGNKNSMADALILFCAIDYIAQQGLNRCIFVSSNSTDFSSASEDKIHEDLKELLDEYDISYFINIGLALNSIEEALVSDESIEQLEQARQLQEALRLISARPIWLADSLKIGGFSATPEIKGVTEVIGRVAEMKAEQMSAFQDALRLASERNTPLANSLKIGRLSAMPEIKRVNDLIRQVKAEQMSAFREALRLAHEHNTQMADSLKIGRLSTMPEIKGLSELVRQFAEDMKTIGGFSAIQEIQRHIDDYKSPLMNSLATVGRFSSSTTFATKMEQDEPQPSDTPEDDEIDKSDDTRSEY